MHKLDFHPPFLRPLLGSWANEDWHYFKAYYFHYKWQKVENDPRKSVEKGKKNQSFTGRQKHQYKISAKQRRSVKA